MWACLENKQVGQSQCTLFLQPIVLALFTDLLPH